MSKPLEISRGLIASLLIFPMLFVGACSSNTSSTDLTTSTSASLDDSIWIDGTPPARPSSVRTAPSYPTDLSDKRKLAGYADSIFVGTIKATNPAPEEKYGTPWTIADVEVVLSLKGANSGVIKVRQQGGIREPSGTVVLVGDDELLLKDVTYIFATVGKAGSQETLIPVYGDIPITNEELSSLKSSGDVSSGMIGRLRAAINNPIPYQK